MHEINMDDQLLMQQLSLHDPNVLIQQSQQVHNQQQNRQNRPRRVKKTPKPVAAVTDVGVEESMNNIKNEIEYMPMKTPISILQELLSRRGKKNIIDFSYSYFHTHLYVIFSSSCFYPHLCPSGRNNSEL